MSDNLAKLNKKIIQCKKCTRLVEYTRMIARKKVKRYLHEEYWGRPLSGFGDLNAQLLIIGLAPAAHGGNRTGRMFTGDSSGDWVAKVLYEHRFATKPSSHDLNDGFDLLNAYITASVKCAPPKNKPLPDEITNCSSYLKNELLILKNTKVIICLGKIAFDSCCKLLNIRGMKFSHGLIFTHNGFVIMSTYHPSRQNTQTGRLTWQQWYEVFSRAKNILYKLNNEL